MRQLQQIPSPDDRTHDIIHRPHEVELRSALFSSTAAVGNRVAFTVRQAHTAGAARPERIEVAISGIGSADGDGGSWYFEGELPASREFVFGCLSTRTNTGWLIRDIGVRPVATPSSSPTDVRQRLDRGPGVTALRIGLFDNTMERPRTERWAIVGPREPGIALTEAGPEWVEISVIWVRRGGEEEWVVEGYVPGDGARVATVAHSSKTRAALLTLSTS